jgi:hypothetical protein
MTDAEVIQAVGAGATVFLALTALVTTFMQGRQLKAVTKQVSVQTDPFVLVSLVQLQSGSRDFAFVIENLGRSPAYRVDFFITPHNERVGTGGLRRLGADFLKQRPTLAPGQRASMRVGADEVYEARNSNSAFDIEIRYAREPNGKQILSTVSRISPAWVNGEHMEQVGLWREIKSLYRQVDQRLVDLTREVSKLSVPPQSTE